MPKYPYRILGTFIDRIFRNNLNDNFKDVEADIKTQKNRVDTLINETEQPSEVVDARTDNNGKVYDTLSNRLNDEQITMELNSEDIKQRQIENIGVGVESGLDVLASSTPDMTVHVQVGVIYMDNGKRYELETMTTIAIDAADSTNPRKDIIYIDTDGQVIYTAGTPASSPTEPSLPGGAHKLSVIDVTAGDTTIEQTQITDTRIMKVESLESLVNRVGQNPDLSTTDKSTIVAALNEIKNDFSAHITATALGDDVHGLATKVIEETGSNSNGEYVRFADGTQICWTDVNVDFTVSGWHPAFNLPATFIGRVVASWSVANIGVPSGGDFTAIQNAALACDGSQWRWQCDGSGATTDWPIALMAIGRWK